MATRLQHRAARAFTAAFGRRETGGVFLLAAGTALFAALVSHSGSDPLPILSAGRTDPTANWLGPVGALGSALVFEAVGFAGLALPIALIGAGLRRLRPATTAPDPAGARSLILASLLVSGAGILALAHNLFGARGFGWGGLVGTMLADGLSAVMRPLGAALVLVAIAAVGVLALRPWGAAGKEDPGSKGRLRRWWTAIQTRWLIHERHTERERKTRRFVARIERRRPARPPRPSPRPKPAGDLFAAAPARRKTRRKTTSGARKAGEPASPWKLPSVQLLTARAHQPGPSRKTLEERKRALEAACEEHGVRGQVARIQPGPVVTTFEYRLGEGETVNKLRNRHEELCMALRAPAIRVERVPGKGVVGVEVPNASPSIVGLREILEAREFIENTGALPVVVGRLVDGAPLVRSLAEMPHLLIAGATGSGKSVQINTLLCSLLFRQTPDDLRLILIDPKRVELRPYRNLPHLLTPLILEPDQAKVVLQHACRELDRRTRTLEEFGVRNIDGYNQQIRRLRSERAAKQLRKKGADAEEVPIPPPMPRLVIIVDELADLFIHARAEVTPAIQRLLSLGRAEGIHLVLATQRPSTDIVSGTLKANLPTRIAFRVASYVDSRTILDRVGAENLLGKGDMLMMQAGAHMPRAQGAFVDEGEVKNLARFWEKAGAPVFDEAMLREEEPSVAPGRQAAAAAGKRAGRDKMLPAARELIIRERKASTSMLQTELGLGYQRARRIVAELERQGVVGPARGSSPREVLVQA